MQPAYPLAPTKPKGAIGLWIGGLLIAVGIVGGILLVVGGVKNISDSVDDMQRVPVADGGTVQLDSTGTYRVFLERPGINDDTALTFQDPTPLVRITDPDGSPVTVGGAGSFQETYSINGRDGRKIGAFTARTTGTFRVATITSDGTATRGEIAIAKHGPTTGIFVIVGGVFGGIGVVIVGIIVMIVSGVRRSRSKQAFGGPPGSNWGAPPPLAGWGQAPGSPSGWAPPPVAPPGGAFPPPNAPPPPPGPQGSPWGQGPMGPPS